MQLTGTEELRVRRAVTKVSSAVGIYRQWVENGKNAAGGADTAFLQLNYITELIVLKLSASNSGLLGGYPCRVAAHSYVSGTGVATI